MAIELTLLVGLGAAGWYWYDTMRARESALRAGREACERAGVLLLDDTVAAAPVGFGRNRRGHLVLRRRYRFEFTDTGNNRRPGSMLLLGTEVQSVALDAAGGTLWEVTR
ncbi:MAG: DUF3301 domain-containing protein [Pseudomonadota bacterium]